MATEVGRSFDEISKKIRTLNSEIRSAKTEVRQFDQVLRLDPKDIQVATKRIQTMETAIADSAKKLTLLRTQQQQAMTEFKEGRLSTKDFEKISASAVRAETDLKLLQLKMKNLRTEAVKADFAKLNTGLTKVQGVSTMLGRTLLGVYASLAAIFTVAIKAGDGLDDIGKKYQTTAEELQIQRNLFDKLTETSSGYEDSLSSLAGILSSIARGRGTAYIATFEKLGIAVTDASGKTKAVAQIYNELFQSLRNITDETERASLANALLGENGYNVAIVAGTETEQILALNAALAENGIISTEQAAQAGAVVDQIADLKIQFSAVAMTLVTALMPAFQTIAQILKDTVIPIIAGLTSWIDGLSDSQQKTILLLSAVVILLPKAIAFIKLLLPLFQLIKLATIGQTGATAGLSAAAAPLVPIFLAIAAALVLLITLMALFSKSAKNTVGQLTGINDQIAQIQNTTAGIVTTNETITQSNQTKDININLDVESKGDSPISQTNADIIAESLAERIDLILGGKMA